MWYQARCLGLRWNQKQITSRQLESALFVRPMQLPGNNEYEWLRNSGATGRRLQHATMARWPWAIVHAHDVSSCKLCKHHFMHCLGLRPIATLLFFANSVTGANVIKSRGGAGQGCGPTQPWLERLTKFMHFRTVFGVEGMIWSVHWVE